MIKDLARFSYLSLQDALEFYFVFDGLSFEERYSDIFEAIDKEILNKVENLSKIFEPLSFKAKNILLHLAKGSRKINDKIALNELIKMDLIKLEKSHEIKEYATFGCKLKKEFRRYQIKDKIHFSKNFYHFWFRFIQPNLTLLLNGDKNAVLKEIKANLEQYFSLPFELICADFLAKKMGILRSEISSYWDKNHEIDIFAKTKDFIVVGEVKYKEHIVCKSLLRELKEKCQDCKILPDFYVIFSKYGFSDKLKKLNEPNVLLFEPNDFKAVL